jgi:hypothetical protein
MVLALSKNGLNETCLNPKNLKARNHLLDLGTDEITRSSVYIEFVLVRTRSRLPASVNVVG